jgi:hypothetical protein
VLDSGAEEITVCNVASSCSMDVKEVYNMGKCVELFCDTIERFIDEDRHISKEEKKIHMSERH